MGIFPSETNSRSSNKMCDDNGKPLTAMLYNVLLSPDLCNRLFSIIKLMNLVHTSIFNKGFCMVLFSDNKHNAVTLPYSAHRKHAFLVKMQEKSKRQKQIPKRKVYLEILHQILRHRFTRSVMTGDTANF